MTGTDLVLATEGGDVVPATGTDVALIPDGAAEQAAQDPPQIPKSKTRDPQLMTPLQARRLINRVRRTMFYLGLEVVAWETPFKEDTTGWRTSQLVPTTAKALMAIMDDLERRHSSHYVRVRHDEPGSGRFSVGFLVVYG